MQTENIGDLAQDQRPHGHFAVFEELTLTIDNGLRHTMDGLEALLNVLDQPARLLQLGGQVTVASSLLGKNLGVKTIDAQTGVGIGIDVVMLRCYDLVMLRYVVMLRFGDVALFLVFVVVIQVIY